MISKKAVLGSQGMIFLFIAVLIIVTAGIVIGSAKFFGSEYDMRKVDAALLNNKLKSCISENEFDFSLSADEVLSQIYKTCRINQKAIESNFLIYIDLGGSEKPKAGPGDLTQCALSELNPNYPICITSTLQKGDLTIFILTGSAQKAEKKIA